MHGLREDARERAGRRTRRLFGGRVDEVGHRLGLREVELVVEERAPRELAGLGHAQAHPLARLEHARKEQLHHDRTAVALKLQHRLAGIGVGCRKVERDAMVDRLAIGGEERREGCLARSERPRADGRDDLRQVGAGDAHHADAPATRRGGDGGDRVAVGVYAPTLAARPWDAPVRARSGPLNPADTHAPSG
jgi:hypothetical protein